MKYLSVILMLLCVNLYAQSAATPEADLIKTILDAIQDSNTPQPDIDDFLATFEVSYAEKLPTETVTTCNADEPPVCNDSEVRKLPGTLTPEESNRHMRVMLGNIINKLHGDRFASLEQVAQQLSSNAAVAQARANAAKLQ